MTDAPRWMPVRLDDFSRDTRRLMAIEVGVYVRILIDYWQSGPPPDDDVRLAAAGGVSLNEWRKMRPAIAAFFQITDGFWRHAEAEEEMALAARLMEVSRKNGKKGGRPRNPDRTQRKPSRLFLGFEPHSKTQNPDESYARVTVPSVRVDTDIPIHEGSLATPLPLEGRDIGKVEGSYKRQDTRGTVVTLNGKARR